MKKIISGHALVPKAKIPVEPNAQHYCISTLDVMTDDYPISQTFKFTQVWIFSPPTP